MNHYDGCGSAPDTIEAAEPDVLRGHAGNRRFPSIGGMRGTPQQEPGDADHSRCPPFRWAFLGAAAGSRLMTAEDSSSRVPLDRLRPNDLAPERSRGMSVTGIVHTKNEERDIARALRSLRPLCDELLVVDMNSSDRTVEIARSQGARILSVPDFGYVEPAWALALESVTTEWVMRIDADEIVPVELARRLREIVQEDEGDLALIGRTNFMFGDAIQGTGWGPESDQHYFLFKPAFREPGDQDTPIHTVLPPRAGARVVVVPTARETTLWHFNYLDWHHFIEKLNRYTSVEAKAAQNAGKPVSLPVLAQELGRQVLWRGLRRRAWRDGYRGAGLTWMMVTYRAVVYLKHRQLAERGDAARIAQRYDDLAMSAVDA